MRFLFLLFIICCFTKVKAQTLFYQNTFKGGVSGDGQTIFGDISHPFLRADTIHFQNQVPYTALIKKAFLITGKHDYYNDGLMLEKEIAFKVKLNNHEILLDSSDNICQNIVTDAFNRTYLIKLGVKEISSFVNASNNELILPAQSDTISKIGPDIFVYNSYYLLILYEDASLPKVNIEAFVNNKRKLAYDSFSLLSNPILTTNDVGLSITTNFACSNCDGFSPQPFEFNVISSLGSFLIGNLDAAGGIGGMAKKTLPGSFTFENNTLFGLVDDTPNNLIDSTDAVANIKNYIPNNTTQVKVDVYSGFTNDKLKNYVTSLILVHSTPCPARGFADTIVKHTICQGQSISLNTQSIGDIYSWYPKQSLNDNTIANPIATPTTTTNYFVSIDSAGCKHTEQVQVAVTPIPQADTIFASNNVCGGPSGRIIIKPGHGPYEPYTYSLNGGANINDTTFTNLNGGNYNVLITDTRGCTWQSNVITINNTIGVNASFNTQTASSSAIAPLYVYFSNNTSGATNYTWYFPTATSNTYNSNYTFTEAGTYTVTLIAYNNLQQCADTATKTIIVLPQDTAGIFIPNVFSPNGDGANDVFEIRIKNAELEIFEMYDRWGVLVSSALDLTKSNIGNVTHFTWTGRTTSGIECSAGTYFYVIKVKLDSAFSKEGTKEFKGFVTLVK